MTLTVVGLAALALLLTTFAGVFALRQFLCERLDREVTELSRLAAQPKPPPERRPDDWLPKGIGDDAIVLLYQDGKLVPGPGNIDAADGPELGSFDDIKALSGQGVVTLSNKDSGQEFRVKVTETRRGGYAVAAISMSRVDSTVSQMTWIGLGASLGMLILLGLASWRIVGFGLRPLTRMEQTAAAIADGDLSVRVPDTDPRTETGRLGVALNTMLGRIETAVDARVASEQRLRQFLADASHELRTPLTSIRGFAELYRRGGTPPGPELDEAMSRIEQEASRMGLLVEDLLLLAALDEERPLVRSKVDLLRLAADAVRDANARHPGRTITLGSAEPVNVSGDEHRLRQVVGNLVANAVQHTPTNALVSVHVTRSGNDAVLEVADTGPGVPAEHAPHIFERLYRADPHRARSHGGAGLGLAITNSIVKAHGGSLELANDPGHGAVFRVSIPASAE